MLNSTTLTSKLLSKIKQLKRKAQLMFTCCDLCNGKCTQYLLLCHHCLNDLPFFDYKLINSDLLNWPAVNSILPRHKFDHLICLAPYKWPFDQWIRQFKYYGRFELGQLFAQLLSLQWQRLTLGEQTALNDMTHCQSKLTALAIIAVPLHLAKWQKRGYNQSHLIAKEFSKLTGIPYLASSIVRIKATESQVGKSGQNRRKNLQNAFALNKTNNCDFQLPDHILLIDDVVTTGTTANEICNLLKDNGVKKVTLVAACLSIPN